MDNVESISCIPVSNPLYNCKMAFCFLPASLTESETFWKGNSSDFVFIIKMRFNFATFPLAYLIYCSFDSVGYDITSSEED